MGRRDKNCLIQQVLPISSEFLLGHDVRLNGPTDPVSKDDGLPYFGFCRVAEIQGGEPKLAKRLHQAKSSLLIVRKRISGKQMAVTARQPNLLSLGYQITDCEHQSVFSNDAAAALPSSTRASQP